VRCNHPEAAHDAGCGLPLSERNRYFDGKFMSARDFRADPDYLLDRHRLHQRLLHGWGVVCGLRVRPHPRKECRPRWVVVTSGIAIDCCGRELVLAKDTPFELPLPASGDRWPEPLFVCLAYGEEAAEHQPVLYHEGHCDPSRKEANRVKETATIVVRRGDDFEPDCWVQPGGGKGAKCVDDCQDELPGPANVCLEPDCPCGDTVPLARVTPHPTLPEELEIDHGGRRQLPPAPQHLTHIVETNWRHGEPLDLDDLRERNGRLEVSFDRRLIRADGDATGINDYTFQVEWLNILEGERNVVRYDRDNPPALEDGCLAVFTMAPDYYQGSDDRRGGRQRGTLAGSTVYVTLKCDFILDCHENPVDGAHLRGRLPSGDGVPGGEFQSWFPVVYHKEDQGQQQAPEKQEEGAS
jgi:hypothetical protein